MLSTVSAFRSFEGVSLAYFFSYFYFFLFNWSGGFFSHWGDFFLLLYFFSTSFYLGIMKEGYFSGSQFRGGAYSRGNGTSETRDIMIYFF
jgi:hypothetical protein